MLAKLVVATKKIRFASLKHPCICIHHATNWEFVKDYRWHQIIFLIFIGWYL